MRRLQLVIVATAVALLLTLSLGGCSNADGAMRETPSPAPATASPTTAPPPTTTTEEQRILAQYRAFWKIQTPASEAPAERRKSMLEPHTTDPALSRVLRGMRASDNIGQVGYGDVLTHPRITKIEAAVAFIRDCQDGSKAGRKEQ